MGTNGTSSSGKRSNEVSLDISKLLKSTIAEMENLPLYYDEYCIYRVPKELHRINKKAYTPQVVSIGPFHHGKEELKAMEGHKILYLQDFLRVAKVSLEDLFKFIKERETKLRNCYAETIKLSSDEFVKMILLDAVFVITCLLKRSCPDLLPKNDRIYRQAWIRNEVRYDMCMLENQLPFFILEDLLQNSGIICGLSTIELVYRFLRVIWGSSWVTDDILQKICSSNYKVAHFVDFLRICQMPTIGLQEMKQESYWIEKTTPSAIKLRQAGVIFKRKSIPDSHRKLYDMKFDIDKGILEIPTLKVRNTTEFLFRNIQAFEQCHYNPAYRYFNDYICILGMIACSNADVEFLIKKKIIKNWVRGEYDIYRMFINLNKGNLIEARHFYFFDLVDDLIEYSRKRRNRWKARLSRCEEKLKGWMVSLKKNYLYSPWSILSVIAATLLLILTAIQAVCSIVQVA